MTYDEQLARRVREILADESGLSERKMFGGLGFMLDGNMAVAAGSGGGLMIRADPSDPDGLIDGDLIVPMEMGGREMTGWLLADQRAITSDERLRELVQLGIDRARSFPPK
ncbi:TfoX/Sxy family protein [Flexivirga caeni]|uniref:TfoX family protein n=1 Tax=Flexivirga caeni TaxID=2294115 RepID=A0A3M9MFV0_9MICO|nr:TfoX/Sxy family protein [Flexivirga caeni]RNI24421.1 TfoX family protein [Flexivirga caeni]